MRHLITRALALTMLVFATAACGGNSEAELAALPTLAVLPSQTPTHTPSPTDDVTATPTLTETPLATDTATAPPTETSTATATIPPTATVDLTVTSYYATQYALATINAENAAAIETFDAAGLIPTTTPTQPPVATVPPETILYTQDGGVRVRECPFISEDCPDVVPELAEGIAVQITGTITGDEFRRSSLWYQVEVSGVTGFVHGSLMGETPPIPTLLPADLTLTALAPQPLDPATASAP